MYYFVDSSISYSPHQSKGKKRKDVTHDNTREDIKELKPNSPNESLGKIMSSHDRDAYTKNITELETLDLKDKVSNDLSACINFESGNLIYQTFNYQS